MAETWLKRVANVPGHIGADRPNMATTLTDKAADRLRPSAA